MKLKWKDTCMITALIISVSVFLLQTRPDPSITSASHLPDSFPVFVIDAGHGGEDGGAVSNDGTEEKAINLAFSMCLRDISQLFGFQTVMTRETDCDLSDDLPTVRQRKVSDIKKRTQISDTTPNSVYIGVHQNYYESSSCEGLQVFYANETNNSRDIAASIQSYTAASLQKNNSRQVKNAGSSIYILSHAVQPAVLVECGFMSNDAELAMLCTKSYQSGLSFCIFMGLLNYYTTAGDL